ncbi:unnamed protein product, partial [Ectocarpus sp. 12 AP-2014]
PWPLTRPTPTTLSTGLVLFRRRREVEGVGGWNRRQSCGRWYGAPGPLDRLCRTAVGRPKSGDQEFYLAVELHVVLCRVHSIGDGHSDRHVDGLAGGRKEDAF